MNYFIFMLTGGEILFLCIHVVFTKRDIVTYIANMNGPSHPPIGWDDRGGDYCLNSMMKWRSMDG